ncbi:hypothetical protein [Edaphocola flava]|uniref:hypothetical protein n=1 Tax=Edaphocola flava TaxID=2499629 RepID=UPI00100A67EC|nr:hypothetical protein [Edaphocola flava]
MNNYNKAKLKTLQNEKILIFIDDTISMLNKNCIEESDFRPYTFSYIDKLKNLNLSRLESFIIIQEIRDRFEELNPNMCDCIDSFIHDIYTRHIGDYPISGILRFKNEPTDLKELHQFVCNNLWLQDKAWENN